MAAVKHNIYIDYSQQTLKNKQNESNSTNHKPQHDLLNLENKLRNELA